MSRSHPRTGWYAGTRGEALLLGPLFRRVRPQGGGSETHRFIATGEQGVQLIQALDALGLRPDETMELLPPDDDPAIRFNHLAETVERDVRRNRVTRIVCSGFGPTAAACALVAHARHARVLWLRPADACGLIARQGWERGLAGMIGSFQCVAVEPAPVLPIGVIRPLAPVPPVTGRRLGAPLALVSVGRAQWGMEGILGRLVAALGDWARAVPDADILILLSMDMRLHGPLRSMADRPGNLLSTAPLPPEQYASLLSEARVMLTDSPHVASESLARGLGVLAFGESEPAGIPAPPNCMHVAPGDLTGPSLASRASQYLSTPKTSDSNPQSATLMAPDLPERIQRWLAD